jgi:hypothetical protein
MLLIRVALLAVLICLHVVGGAVLFRRIFPRESPWWGLFIPTLGLITLLNFIEHGVALPKLVWLLPFSTVGLIWLLARTGRSWKALRLPGILFLVVFAFTLAIKCMQPDINFYYTEGLTDMNRILNFCFGDKLPPTDSWLPPYPQTGYYTFMHYGASVLKRLLDVDVGTACNLASAFVSALTLLACGAAAHSLSRHRTWITVLVVVVMAGGFTGSTPILTLLQPQNPDPTASIDIGGGVDDPTHQIFAKLLLRDQPQDAYRIYTPGCYIYYPEFHATMAGHLLALLAVFAAAEVLRRKRAIFPWIYLSVAPLLTIIACPWFFFIVGLLAWPTLLLAYVKGRRSPQWNSVFVGAALAMVLLWPAVNDISHGSAPEAFCWSWQIRRDCWTFIIQWWPVYLPWIVLGFAWRKMDLAARWLHFILVPILLCTELFYFTDRGTTLEKTWSGTMGVSMAVLYPVLFLQKGWLCRGMSMVVAFSGLISLGAWTLGTYGYMAANGCFLHLEGDHFIQTTPQLHRMEEVLSSIKGRTVITGKAQGAFFESTCLPAFTGNRCYLGWTNAEETCGHPDEAHFREQQINDLYAGTVLDPLHFLESRDIAAVMVWPDDKMSDAWLDKMKLALAPGYTYVDCKHGGDDNAGIFMRNPRPE